MTGKQHMEMATGLKAELGMGHGMRTPWWPPSRTSRSRVECPVAGHDRAITGTIAGTSRGERVCYVELFAPLEERLRGNTQEGRLAEEGKAPDEELSSSGALDRSPCVMAPALL